MTTGVEYRISLRTISKPHEADATRLQREGELGLQAKMTAIPMIHVLFHYAMDAILSISSSTRKLCFEYEHPISRASSSNPVYERFKCRGLDRYLCKTKYPSILECISSRIHCTALGCELLKQWDRTPGGTQEHLLAKCGPLQTTPSGPELRFANQATSLEAVPLQESLRPILRPEKT